jgi:hypothetical protein
MPLSSLLCTRATQARTFLRPTRNPMTFLDLHLPHNLVQAGALALHQRACVPSRALFLAIVFSCRPSMSSPPVVPRIPSWHSVGAPDVHPNLILVPCHTAALSQMLVVTTKEETYLETWVPMGPHRPGSWRSLSSGPDLSEAPPTCKWTRRPYPQPWRPWKTSGDLIRILEDLPSLWRKFLP